MNTKTHPATGVWYVEAQESRAAGKWQREYEFAPGEWLIGFTPDGRLLESFRPENENTVRKWSFDDSTGIISIFSEPPGFPPQKCVFGPASHLYYYDDLPYIPEEPVAIIEHHASERLKLVRVGE